MTLPSPIPSLRGLIEKTVTVADVVTAPLFLVSPNQQAADAAELLKARDFDLAGIAEEPVSRYVTRDALTGCSGLAGDVAQVILATDTVERSLPLVELAKILRHKSHVFILDLDTVRWVATCADLQAPAVSVVVLSYLFAIEIGLASLIPVELGDSWLTFLPAASRQHAEDLFESKRLRNVETGLEDCLYFKDWLHLVTSSQALLSDFGFTSKSAFRKATGSFADLRNDLAHGGTLLDASSTQLAIDRFTRIRSFAESVWEVLDQRREDWEN